MNLFTRLTKIFQKEGVTQQKAKPREEQVIEAKPEAHADHANIERANLVYPPVDPGMPVAGLKALLDAQKDLTTRIKTHSAMEGARYALRFGGPIERLANYIGAIPGTSNGLYAGPGGLLKACVEMSLYSFQASHGRIFTGHLGVEQRFLLEVRWQYVCFAAGLIWPIGKTIDQIQVASNSGVTWPARAKPLLEWAEQSKTHHLHINWPEEDFKPGPSASCASLLVPVLGEENLQWLEDGSPAMVTALMGIVSGYREAKYGIAFDLINEMWRRVCQAEEARNPKTYGRAMYGQHMGPHILDCVAVLISNGIWKQNVSPLIVNENGVYLVWPDAGEDILKVAAELGKQGFPNTTAGLLSTIEKAKLILVDSNIGPLMDIADEEGEIKSSIKMVKPMSVIGDYDPGNYVSSNKTQTSKEIETGDTAGGQLYKHETKSESTGEQECDASKPEQEQVLVPPAAGEDPFSSVTDIGNTVNDSVADGEIKKGLVDEQNVGGQDAQTASILNPKSFSEASRENERNLGAAGDDSEMSFKSRQNQSENTPKTAILDEDVKEIKYSDLLPKDLRSSLNNMTAETLGKLVMLWRENGPNDQMRTVEKGIAISVVSLKGLVHDAPSFIESLAQQGYIDINPLTPGKKIQEVAIPEGGKRRVSCFVLSRGLAQKLGL